MLHVGRSVAITSSSGGWQSTITSIPTLCCPLRVIPVNDRGEILQERYQALLVPIAEMIHAAKRYDATVLIDGAQTVAHVPVNAGACIIGWNDTGLHGLPSNRNGDS